MNYAIIGFGAVGQALANMFARKGIDVGVATTRSPDTIAPKARTIGSTIAPMSLPHALQADIIFLAVPYWAHRDVAKAGSNWQGKTIVDVTNSYGVSPEDLGDLSSSTVVSKAFPGAGLVKAFNHLPAEILAKDPEVNGGRRVVFLSSDDEKALPTVTALVQQLGYAPVNLGGLEEGGRLVQAKGSSWGPLNFQELFKFGG
jgi:8-hydroxy-5-deazaflavin:NADPH oxidoreductase